MTGRFLSTLVALVVLAAPASAGAQTDPNTSDYDTTPPLSTTPTSTATTPAPTPEPTPEPEPADEEVGVQAEQAESPAPAASNAAPATAAGASTGTPPSTLAYTGSEAWLLGLVGLLAIAGGAALMRPSRRT